MSNDIIYIKQKDIKKVRNELLIKQNNICPICNREVVNPCLDHFHTKRINGTGLCRGVICSSCNIFLGKIENNINRCRIKYDMLSDVLKNISEYINTSTNYMHPSEIKNKKEKLSKREYNKIKKYYFVLYPKRKKMLDYPKSGYKTKEIEKILDDTNKYLDKK